MALIIRSTPSMWESGAPSPLGGVPGLSYLGADKQKDPVYGEQWVIYYESAASNDGTIASPCEEAYNNCPAHFRPTLKATGPKHSLTVYCPLEPSGSIAANAQVATTYELLGNEVQLDIREHPKSLNLGYAVIRDIDAKLGGGTEVTIPVGEATTLYQYLQQRNGNGYFQKSQYVFRYTRITSRLATIDVGYTNINKIHTMAQMIAQTGAPSGILAAIQDAQAEATPTILPAGFEFGWLKQSPTVSSVAGNKVQITGEYVLETWSTWVYAVAT